MDAGTVVLGFLLLELGKTMSVSFGLPSLWYSNGIPWQMST